MARPTAVINVVGLTESLLGPHAPNLGAFRERGTLRRLAPVLPAVTCPVQSSMLTGTPVTAHGIVGNGWYDRDLAEVQFWKQSNRLVRGEKVWETARRRDPSVTCLNMFWWYNMYSSADLSVTPRPIYKADGRKIPDCYSEPPALRAQLQDAFGRFPLFDFWGPRASIASSRWIADATMWVWQREQPTLTLVYLPHLDYDLQREGPEGPGIPRAVAEIDAVVGALLEFFAARGVRVIVLSEYGIEPATDAVAVNRLLREAGMLRTREEDGLELLDAGASAAFAVADHQIAHVYAGSDGDREKARAVLEGADGIDLVLARDGRREHGIDHDRAGDLVLVADHGRWFTYDYWEDDARAPDFARTVDIHRKPGYDPRELLLDPALRLPGAAVAWKLLKKKLGFRQLLDVVPLETNLVRGTHGRTDMRAGLEPVLLTAADGGHEGDRVPCTAVHHEILRHLFDD